jgi:hypothetical protein
MTAVPFEGVPTDLILITSALVAISTSVSLDNTLIVTAVSSLVLLLSFTATGGSLIGFTVIFTVAVLVEPAVSCIVYVKESTPLKLAFGV